MTSTVIGLYDNMQDAQQVVRELRDMGLGNDRISLVANDASGEYAGQLGQTGATGRKGKHDDTGAETGAGIGAVLGGIGGLLVGLGALTIPGIGPVLAAGPLATAVAAMVGAGVGAVAGAATGGLLGALVDMGIPEEQAGYYSEGVRRGGILVVVEAEDEDVDRVREVMNRYNPVDIDERASEWRSAGWHGFDANAQPYTSDQMLQDRGRSETRTLNANEEARLPVVEEELRVGKRQVQRGGVQVHTRVIETPVEENVRLRQEHVSVERRPVDRPISGADAEAFVDATIEVTEMGEEAVVEKRAHVIEEVVVRKDVEERDETVRDTVRRTDVDVDQAGGRARGAGDMTGMADRSTAYRGHYQTNFANSGYQYDHYEPAYMYGSQLYDYEGYQGWEWDRVEPEARTAWEQRNPGTWERIRDAVRYGWDSMRDTARGESSSSSRQSRR